MSASAFLLSASSTNTHCQPWELEPVGACSANSRQSSSTSRGTGFSRSSRLRTERVVVRTSSKDRFRVISRDYIRATFCPRACVSARQHAAICEHLPHARARSNVRGLYAVDGVLAYRHAPPCTRGGAPSSRGFGQRKSRLRDDTRISSLPIRSATTVTAP